MPFGTTAQWGQAVGGDRGSRAGEPGSGRVSGAGTIESPRWPRASLASAAGDEQRIRRGFWRKAGRVAARLPFAEDLLAAYFCAFDPATPFPVKAALMGTLAYFVLPFDFVPDLLPFFGFADDAAVLLTTLRLVSGSLRPEHRDAARAALERMKRRA